MFTKTNTRRELPANKNGINIDIFFFFRIEHKRVGMKYPRRFKCSYYIKERNVIKKDVKGSKAAEKLERETGCI